MEGISNYRNILGLKAPQEKKDALSSDSYWKMTQGVDVFKRDFFVHKKMLLLKYNVDLIELDVAFLLLPIDSLLQA